MNIRQARLTDAENILALHADTLKRVNAKDYRPEQINAWLAMQRLDRVQKLITNGHATVAVDDDDHLLGFATRRGNEIHGMYVDADRLGRGIAGALFARVEADAKEEGCTQLVAEASVTAVVFYRKMGFAEVQKKLWPLTDSLSLEVVVMRKDISGQPGH